MSFIVSRYGLLYGHMLGYELNKAIGWSWQAGRHYGNSFAKPKLWYNTIRMRTLRILVLVLEPGPSCTTLRFIPILLPTIACSSAQCDTIVALSPSSRRAECVSCICSNCYIVSWCGWNNFGLIVGWIQQFQLVWQIANTAMIFISRTAIVNKDY